VSTYGSASTAVKIALTHNEPPTARKLLEAEGITGWLTEKQAALILSRYQSTVHKTVWENEKTYFTYQDLKYWRIWAASGLQCDPHLVLGTPTGNVTEFRAMILDIEMLMGASGATIEQYPVGGDNKAVIIRREDPKDEGRETWNCKVVTNGWPYNRFNLHDHRRLTPIELEPQEKVDAIIARGPIAKYTGVPLTKNMHLFSTQLPTSIVDYLTDGVDVTCVAEFIDRAKDPRHRTMEVNTRHGQVLVMYTGEEGVTKEELGKLVEERMKRFKTRAK
jgi:hypothetical protein